MLADLTAEFKFITSILAHSNKYQKNYMSLFVFNEWRAVNLSDDKIRRDFIDLVNLDVEKECLVPAYDRMGNEYMVKISREDKITVIAVRIILPHKDIGFFPIEVNIGIGGFQTEVGTYGVEKCTASLLYNDKIELQDIDFEYNKTHDLKNW